MCPKKNQLKTLLTRTYKTINTKQIRIACLIYDGSMLFFIYLDINFILLTANMNKIDHQLLDIHTRTHYLWHSWLYRNKAKKKTVGKYWRKAVIRTLKKIPDFNLIGLGSFWATHAIKWSLKYSREWWFLFLCIPLCDCTAF